ncbi:MAG: hypothetical protein KC486_32960 [Myxococcales bacterium]|nr:hypothetical protein [Myxococcales bacterium]
MHPLLEDGARAQIHAAVEAIEARTSAEIVVAVERRAGTYATPRALLGIALAVACQLFLLFAEAPFPLDWFVVMPLAAGLVGALLGSLAPLQRRLTPSALRRQRVLQAAQAAFYRHRVGHTRAHTGILIYFALTEGQAELVADTGVLKVRPREAWQRSAAAIDEVLGRGGRPQAVANALEVLGDVLAGCLPARDDDANELADEVHYE